jgi:hypothetical protein
MELEWVGEAVRDRAQSGKGLHNNKMRNQIQRSERTAQSTIRTSDPTYSAGHEELNLYTSHGISRGDIRGRSLQVGAARSGVSRRR